MKIEKKFRNETIRYESVGNDKMFLKKNIRPDGEITKEKLIEIKNIQEFKASEVKSVKDAFRFFVKTKGFQYIEREKVRA